MISATRELAAAAEACDRELVTDAFDSLTATCRSCHALYRACEASTCRSRSKSIGLRSAGRVEPRSAGSCSS